MSQSNLPNRGAPNILPVVISAVVVFVVLGLIFGLLLSRPSPQQVAQGSTQTAQTLEQTSAALQAEQATSDANVSATAAAQPSAAAQPTSASGASGASGSKVDKYPSPPPMTIDPAKNYTATITTPRGDIVIKLRPDLAPETVNSFVFLSREGFYDGLTWHRVIQNFMAQGGDPAGDGTGGPGYTVKGEFTDKVLFDKPGIVAMARPGNDVNGNGSQFFITTAPYPSLNSQYTIFGEVIKGQEIVDAIPLRDPGTATTPGETIEKITITEG